MCHFPFPRIAKLELSNLLFISCLIVDKLLNFSRPQMFYFLKRRDHPRSFVWVLSALTFNDHSMIISLSNLTSDFKLFSFIPSQRQKFLYNTENRIKCSPRITLPKIISWKFWQRTSHSDFLGRIINQDVWLIAIFVLLCA